MIKMMIKEIWKTPIYDGETYEGFEVSNLGRIKSLNYRRTGKPKLMTPVKRKDSYFTVTLRKNKETKKCYVHRLVAETFLPNPENKPCINHKIEGKKGKSMNFVFFNEDGTLDKERTTIEWVTYKENNNYGSHNERISDTEINDPNKSKKVIQFSKTGDFIREWPSTQECGRNGFAQSAVAACCRGEQKTAYGFIWKYS